MLKVGTVAGQRDSGRTQHVCQHLSLLEPANPALLGCVEPHVAEVQLEGAVCQQAAGTTDVVVVDVGDDEQVNVTPVCGVRCDRGYARTNSMASDPASTFFLKTCAPRYSARPTEPPLARTTTRPQRASLTRTAAWARTHGA